MGERFSISTIASVFQSVHPDGGHVMRITPLERIHSHDGWCIETSNGAFVLQVARIINDPARMLNAVATQRLATGTGVPSPRIVAYNTGALLGWPLHIQEWWPGQDADTSWPLLNASQREAVARGFGRAAGRMHTIAGPCFSEADPVVDSVRLELWVFDPYPEARPPSMQGYRELRPLAQQETNRLSLYRGMEYLAEPCRNDEREVQLAADFATRLEQWLMASETADGSAP